MSKPDTLLSVRGLCLERGERRLLTDFDLEVSAGDLWLLEGANGAGKTTLLRSLAGLSELGQQGEVTRHTPDLLYLGHRPGIKLMLTPRENLRWFCDARGADVAGIEPALQAVGLDGRADVLCRSLSAGQQRRVGLARLYLPGAALWLLDEPFTAIDRDGVAGLAQTILAHVDGGGAVIMTSHQDFPVTHAARRISL